MSASDLWIFFGSTLVLLWVLLRPRRHPNKKILFAALLLFAAMPMISFLAVRDILSIEITAILYAVLLAGSAFLVVRTGRPLNANPRFAISMLILLMVSLILAVLVGGNLSYLPRALPAVLPLLFGCVVLTRPQHGELLLRSAALALAAIEAGSLLLLALSPQSYFEPDGSQRFTGPLSHSNAFGSLAAFVAVASLTLLNGWRRVFGVVVSISCVFLTDQRSALVAVLVGFVCYFVFAVKPSLFMFFCKTIVLVATPFLAYLLLSTDLIENLFGRRQISLDYRTDVLDFVFLNIENILPLGISPQEFYSRTTGLSFIGGFSHPHNSWLTYLVMGGIAGGLAWSLLTLSSIVRSFTRRRFDLLSIIVTAAALGVAESPTFADTNWLMIPTSCIAVLAWLSAWYVRETPVSARGDDGFHAGKGMPDGSRTLASRRHLDA